VNKRILGIDMNDQRTILSYYSEERIWTFPTAVCRDSEYMGWSVGSTAYESVLAGKGIITDKLYSFVQKDRITTLYGTEYNSVTLMYEFLRMIIRKTVDNDESLLPTYLVLCIPTIDVNTVDRLYESISRLGIDRNNTCIISRAEAFIYYTMSQSPDMRNNNVALFSLEDNELTYYELKVQRKAKSTLVFADKELLDESFNLDILRKEAGSKLADKILLSCAERLFKNKVYSSVFVTGAGFSEIEWAQEFMRFVCNRRKVFSDEELFSRGAGFRGADLASEKPIFSFTPICDGRIDSSVYININRKDRVIAYPIINIGDPWYSAENTISLIPYNIEYLDLSIVPMDERKRKNVHIPLSFLPDRPDRTSKLSMHVRFKNAGHMYVVVKDMGFGDLFPSSGNSVSEEVALWD